MRVRREVSEIVLARGDGHAVVERSVDLRVGAGVQARLTMNLNAGTWLGQADAGTRTVTESAFEGAVTIAAGER